MVKLVCVSSLLLVLATAAFAQPGMHLVKVDVNLSLADSAQNDVMFASNDSIHFVAEDGSHSVAFGGYSNSYRWESGGLQTRKFKATLKQDEARARATVEVAGGKSFRLLYLSYFFWGPSMRSDSRLLVKYASGDKRMYVCLDFSEAVKKTYATLPHGRTVTVDLPQLAFREGSYIITDLDHPNLLAAPGLDTLAFPFTGRDLRFYAPHLNAVDRGIKGMEKYNCNRKPPESLALSNHLFIVKNNCHTPGSYSLLIERDSLVSDALVIFEDDKKNGTDFVITEFETVNVTRAKEKVKYFYTIDTESGKFILSFPKQAPRTNRSRQKEKPVKGG
ncbi:hypothetical protein [Chryseolinea lacunae]|uniref:Uncharacterized protein n=1 Tax=Chryseolinea lacunae TaxID=2801331 RepID=A0ABS1KUZ9_9BACT|nr:hypothetical protein [Chryseolinea lacunae]MBL0743194.1 hypothetical protein [Chryseolinea lacunae]